MFLTSSPTADKRKHRLMFRDAWLKHIAGAELNPLEKQIVDVIQEHPEYHNTVATLRDEDEIEAMDLSRGATVENPFLHMGLHLALREQVGTDRPLGIKLITRQLLQQYPDDGHQVEHLMMEKLAESLWEAQQRQRAPDEQNYMEQLRRLV